MGGKKNMKGTSVEAERFTGRIDKDLPSIVAAKKEKKSTRV